MKYNSSQMALEAISDGALLPFEIFEAMMISGYGASGQKRKNALYKIQSERGERARVREEHLKLKQRYDSLIYKLKRDGLIAENIKSGEKKYSITKEGGEKLERLKSKEGFPDTYYQREKGTRVIIVMFDIPEDQKKKRAWLRLVLVNLDFKMAQKSVWVGKTKIPKTLITDLMRMGMEDFVEIFEVGSTGNLKNLI